MPANRGFGGCMFRAVGVAGMVTVLPLVAGYVGIIPLPDHMWGATDADEAAALLLEWYGGCV